MKSLVCRGGNAMRWLKCSLTLVAGLAACENSELPEATDTGEPATGIYQAHVGQPIYDELCASCHESGVGGAPVTGRRDDWSERSPLWMGVLAEHAEKGYLRMPAKGGNENLTDADVQAATDYMLSVTNPQLLMD